MELLSALGPTITLDSPPGVALDAYLTRQAAAHPWNGGSAAEWSTIAWAWQAWRAGKEYGRAPLAWEREHPRPTRLLDWRAVAVEEVVHHLEAEVWPELRIEEPATPQRVQSARMIAVDRWLKLLPAYWDPAQLRWTAGRCPELLDVLPDVRRLCELPELEALAAHLRLQVMFRAKPKESHGQRALGSVKKLGPKERLLHVEQPAPNYLLELDAQYWLAMGGLVDGHGHRPARARLLHHELMHCAITEKDGHVDCRTRGHGWEDHGSTVERYGPLGEAHALAIQRAYLHPRTQELLGDHTSGTFLVGSKPPGEGRRVSARTWHHDLTALREALSRAQRAWLESPLDWGPAPWADLQAQLDSLVLIAEEDVREADVQRAETLHHLIRRWAPRGG